MRSSSMRFAPHSTEVKGDWETQSACPEVLTSAITIRGGEFATDAQ
jgi:hypothetical protein